MTPREADPELARRLFDCLEAQGVRACALGVTEALPERIGGDLDLLVDPAQVRRLPRVVLAFARHNGAQLVQALWQQRTSWYIVLAAFGSDGWPRFLFCDFYGTYLHDGQPLLRCRELLTGARPAIDDDGYAKGFFTLAPADEFLCYFLKKVAKNALNGEQGRHLSAVFREDPKGAAARLRRYWPAPEVEMIARGADSGDWSEIAPAFGRLKAALRRRGSGSVAAGIGELPRIVARLLRPSGLWIVVLGPDGSGKSTLIDRLLPEVAPAFRQTRMFHLRPGTVPGTTPAGMIDDPHGLPPRGLAASVAKLGYYFSLYVVGYWLRVWPALVRSTFVAFDRYYHDMLVDHYRYRFDGPHWLARLVGAVLPRPDLWILLDVPPEVIWSRKREVPLPELERQCRAYREFVRGLPGGHVVDGSRGTDEVVRSVARIVLDHMADRSARRFG